MSAAGLGGTEGEEGTLLLLGPESSPCRERLTVSVPPLAPGSCWCRCCHPGGHNLSPALSQSDSFTAKPQGRNTSLWTAFSGTPSIHLAAIPLCFLGCAISALRQWLLLPTALAGLCRVLFYSLTDLNSNPLVQLIVFFFFFLMLNSLCSSNCEVSVFCLEPD